MRLITIAATAAALALAGCATPYRPSEKDAQFAAQAAATDRPLIAPARSFSSYSASLGCMDRLLRDMRLPTTLITSKYINDPTGKVSVATKEMIITALSQMSRTSSAFRFVDYEVDIVRQDTVQNLTTLLLGANQMQIQRPALYVSGAVSFVDQNIINNRNDIGTSANRLQTGYSNNRGGSLIGLEMHLGEFRTRTLIPGVDSANEVVVSNGGQGLDVAGRIGSYGVQFNVGRDFTQGTGAALRTLIELGVIEVIGKWARVPYWQCLSLDQTHPDFQRSLLDWYTSDSEDQKRSNISNALFARGYLAGSTVEDADLKKALVRFQADEDLVPHGRLTFEVYERAMRDYVRVDTQGHFSRVGWDKSQVVSRKTDGIFTANTLADTNINPSATTAITPGTDTGTASADKGTSNRIDLKIENVPSPANRMATSFMVGEQIFMSAVLQQTAHVWCYYQDAGGNAMRIYPNSTHRYSLTQANRSIRLPDWMNPNPGFFIEANEPGREKVLCLSSDKDLLADAKAGALNAQAFENLKGLNLSSILTQFMDMAKDKASPLSSSSVAWDVRRKQVAEAPQAEKPKAP